jgi:DtxR family Mn-dependent transcriptional regulator
MFTATEENYLKALFRLGALTEGGKGPAGTNELALELDIRPATVNGMLKKLREKGLVEQRRYGKILLTEAGRLHAVEVIRKHRLWETFLYEKLHFTWDEVHDVAEQLEHIRSVHLTDRLEEFLGYPSVDPHGDPIPDKDGRMPPEVRRTLAESEEGHAGRIVGVCDNSAEFLQYLDRLGLSLGLRLIITRHILFDGSVELESAGIRMIITRKVAENLLVD